MRKFDVFDVNGKLCETKNIDEQNTIFGSTLEKGIYFIQIISNGESKIRKIIKK